MATAINTDKARLDFLEALFGTLEGYVCIAFAPQTKRKFEETFFRWPSEAPKILDFVKQHEQGHNMWIGAQLYDEPHRKKIYVNQCNSLWADLDTCHPDDVNPKPTVVVQSSDGRYQGYWPLKHAIPGAVAEEYSRRIAYAHRDQGADTSGWDLTQLLRIPYTFNYKYDSRPIVQLAILRTSGGSYVKYAPEEFEQLPQVPGGGTIKEYRDPPARLLKGTTILEQHRNRLPDWIVIQFSKEPAPGDDWSMALWSFMLGLFEHSFTTDEVYAIASDAACNKFARDGNPERLWPDVLRAETYHSENSLVAESAASRPPPDLRPQEPPVSRISFVERYVTYAKKHTDAPEQYHEAGAFFILSALLAGSVSLESSMGTTQLNLWFMILGNTTLTRKTTAMSRAVKMIEAIDENIILATEEGSIEGIMDSLSTRPKRPSVFYRDEISGMLKGMARKDYLAGMLESFTKLYDGTTLRRMLRKEQIIVKEPIFIIFGGGIRKAVLAAVNDEHVSSGFLPRFLFFSGQSDLSNIKPVGRKTEDNKEAENALLSELHELAKIYKASHFIEVGGEQLELRRHVTADATDEAWARFNEFQMTMMEYAHDAPNADHLLPTLDRTGMSMMKMACLLAAARQEPDVTDRITVELADVEHAIYYISKWVPYTLEIISGVGRTAQEQLLEDVYDYVKKHRGCVRSLLMRTFKMTAFDYKVIADTLVARGMVKIQKAGRGERWYATDIRD